MEWRIWVDVRAASGEQSELPIKRAHTLAHRPAKASGSSRLCILAETTVRFLEESSLDKSVGNRMIAEVPRRKVQQLVEVAVADTAKQP
jgi:hypothetical protein